MFLVTTADERLWKRQSTILFLGGWCRTFTRREAWESLSYRIMPYPWDDRTELYRAYQYVASHSDEILRAMGGALNAIHGTDCSPQYWNIVLGSWLTRFSDMVLERVLCLETAAKAGVTDTWIGAFDPLAWIPGEYTNFDRFLLRDGYNHVLYSQIITQCVKLPYTVQSHLTISPSREDSAPAARATLSPLRSLQRHWTRAALISSGMTWRQRLRAAAALSTTIFSTDQMPILPNTVASKALRSAFARELAARLIMDGSSYHAALLATLPWHIPRVHLEGYRETLELGLASFPKRPSYIFTANGLYSHEAFKLWAAHHVEHHSAKLVIFQHGGHYGTGLWSRLEDYELSLPGVYCSWGWSRQGNAHIRPVSSPILAGRKKKIKQHPAGDVLLASCSLPRYAYSLYSAPVTSQLIPYYGTIVDFFDHLSPEGKRLLLHRLNPSELGWCEHARFQAMRPQMRLYQGPEPFAHQLNRSRLFVATYNSTMFLETFAADYPTIIFWDPSAWELRSEAEPYFQRLSEAGIFFPSPSTAAKQVNAILENPGQWWRQNKVQAAKEYFCDRFGRHTESWPRELREAVKN